ncbi:hypothetical protein ACHAWF_012656 [Thalassiosira exigua]
MSSDRVESQEDECEENEASDTYFADDNDDDASHAIVAGFDDIRGSREIGIGDQVVPSHLHGGPDVQSEERTQDSISDYENPGEARIQSQRESSTSGILEVDVYLGDSREGQSNQASDEFDLVAVDDEADRYQQPSSTPPYQQEKIHDIVGTRSTAVAMFDTTKSDVTSPKESHGRVELIDDGSSGAMPFDSEATPFFNSPDIRPVDFSRVSSADAEDPCETICEPQHEASVYCTIEAEGSLGEGCVCQTNEHSAAGHLVNSDDDANVSCQQSSNATPSQPTVIHDKVGPKPTAMTMAMFEIVENDDNSPKQSRGRVELIDDDGSGAAMSIGAQMDSILFTSQKDNPNRTGAISKFGELNELTPPMPFNPSQKGNANETGALSNFGDLNELTPPMPIDSSMIPIEQDSDLQFTTISGHRFVNRMEGVRIGKGEYISRASFPAPEIQPAPMIQAVGGEMSHLENDEEPRGSTVSGAPIDEENQARSLFINATEENTAQHQRETVPGITEAYLVDDNIIVATPALPNPPWWKQRKARLVLAFVFAIVLSLAITLGRILSESSNAASTLDSSTSPSISTFPSMSQVPSSTPTDCLYTILSDVQELDLLNPTPEAVAAALDGRHLVVVSRGDVAKSFGSCENWNEKTMGTLYVIFYSLTESNEWERVYHVVEAINFGPCARLTYDVAISGETAIVGLPSGDTDGSGVVNIYQQSSAGLWGKVGSLKEKVWWGFGWLVGIDNDLMVVSSHYHIPGTVPDQSSVFVYQRIIDTWEKLEVVDFLPNNFGKAVSDVRVDGDMIAIFCWDPYGNWDGSFIELYRFDRSNSKVSHAQRVESPLGHIQSIVAMNNKHLVFSSGPEPHHKLLRPIEGVSIYQWQDERQSFGLIQHMNSSRYSEGFGRTLALGSDTLVVGSNNGTHIFSLQTEGIESWGEVLVLNTSYVSSQISGWTLSATNRNEVHMMNVADCTQSEPTQMPSISAAPTTCYPVEFIFVDSSPSSEHNWEASLHRITSHGYTHVKTFSDQVKDPQQVEEDDFIKVWKDSEDLLCLREGRYRFTFLGQKYTNYPEFEDNPLDVHYSVKSNEHVIAREGDLYSHEILYTRSIEEFCGVHVFDIPYDPTVANPPTGRPLSPRPTWPYRPIHPTISPWPTRPPTTLWPTWQPQPNSPFPTESPQTFPPSTSLPTVPPQTFPPTASLRPTRPPQTFSPTTSSRPTKPPQPICHG